MAIQVPIVLGVMAAMMLKPSRAMAKEFGIPDAVMREAYTDKESLRQGTRDSVRKLRKLCRELGLTNPVSLSLWKRLQIWDED